jgi:hypothetical protein
MARRFILRPLAEADLEDAARWYHDERAGLGERFLSDVDRTWRAFASDHSSSLRYPATFVERCCTRSRMP